MPALSSTKDNRIKSELQTEKEHNVRQIYVVFLLSKWLKLHEQMITYKNYPNTYHQVLTLSIIVMRPEQTKHNNKSQK